jgi:thiamine monophosphate synthase
VALGPIWASPTKQGHADVVGTEALREACSDASLPVVAIGGITTTERAAIAARAGAAWIAVVSALDGDSDDAVHLVARRFALSIAAAHGASGVGAVGPERGLSVA